MRAFTFALIVLLTSRPMASASLVNGDFSAGNSGFQTEYNFVIFNGTEGEYTVRSDPQNWNHSFAPTPDHTTGNGPMLIVNGATSGNPSFWEQTTAVIPGAVYDFSAWVSSAVADGPAELLVEINGTVIGPSFQAPLVTGTWEPLSQFWNSGPSNSATIRLINSNLSVYPNDFYVDDISLVAVPEPSTMVILAGLALVIFKRRSTAFNIAT
jgi:PEP-CTERM motif